MMRLARPSLSAAVLLGAALLAAAAAADEGCRFESLGEGRVSAVIDARTLRLDDAREVRLAGVEVVTPAAIATLRSLAEGQAVTLHGADDAPDRYGRQGAFVYLRSSGTSLQAALLAQGVLLASGTVAPGGCAAELAAAEADARTARRGVWGDRGVTKNAESSGDILAGIGQFTVVEGRVVSVREAGATVYLNFGRRWTRDFAVTIPKRALPAFEAAGVGAKALENRRVRIRGWVDARGGPRIEAVRAGQIELIDRERDSGRIP